MNKYEAVIGLEVHAQLLTHSKMFCACENSFGARPNTNICPVCTGQPGILPVMNRQAVEFAIRAGLATNCTIEPVSEFARKNYFYPDLPKGYQISQYDKPLCLNGHIDIPPKRISIIRIHLEEDAGKLIHDFGRPDSSHVDYNRSSVPLIEIVSGPDIRTPEEGTAYLKTLRSILMYLEICDGNMQEGSFRCDANISIMSKGSKKFGTRTELKNLNSFKAISAALAYEIRRQTEVLDSGGSIHQETLLWDDANSRAVPMRSKEEAHDYRYFPEPDLPLLMVSKEWIENVRKKLPELGNAKAARFIKEFGLPEYDAGVLTQDKSLADYYESCLKHFKSPKKISNWIMTELLRELNNENTEICNCKITPKDLAKLVELVETNAISGKIGKAVFGEMFKTGQPPESVIQAKGMVQISDTEEIEKVIDEILANNADNVAKYRSGKVTVFGHFVGEVMKATKGKANPKVVNEVLKRRLG